MVIVIKEKDTWSIKVINVKTRLPIENYVLPIYNYEFKSLTSHINVKIRQPIDNYAFKSLTSHINVKI